MSPLRRLLAAALLVGAAAVLPACQHPSAEQCERVCWHVNELNFWERFASESASMTPDAREKLRAERDKTWKEMRARAFDPGLENCVKECRAGARQDDADCAERATTASEAAACLK